jgi:hypothetical protein
VRTHAVVIAYGESPAHWTGTGTAHRAAPGADGGPCAQGAPADLRVKLNGFQSLPATIAWQHPKLDVAVLTTTEDFPTGDRPRWLEQVSTGQAWEASGYPRLTQKGQAPATDLHQVTGTTCSCAPGETTLNLVCHTAARLPTAGATAEVPGAPALVYGGLSGAGVWVNGCLAGVVGQLLPELQGSQVQAIPYGAFQCPEFWREVGLGQVPAAVLNRLVDQVSETLRKALADALQLAGAVNNRAVVEALLTRSALDALRALNAVDKVLFDQRQLKERQSLDRLRGTLLPYLTERAGHTWSTLGDGRVHALQVATATVAELIVARLDDREADLVLLEHSAYPVGAKALVASRFAALNLPLADEGGRELEASVLRHHLARVSTDLDLEGLTLAELRRLYKLSPEASLGEIEDNAWFNRHESVDAPRYYLLFDAHSLDWWAIRGTDFCKNMPPSLQIVRLDRLEPTRDEVSTARLLGESLKRR